MDYATVAYDASTGERLWVARYDGPASGAGLGDFASAQAVSRDGTKVFVTGGDEGPEGDAYATVGYDAATGARLWVTRGPVGGGDSIAASSDGSRVFVTGLFAATDRGGFGTVAYDAETGAKQWTALYDGSVNGGDWGRVVRVSGDGAKVFVTGASGLVYRTGSNLDYATVGYDAATGAQLWAARYDGPPKDCVVPKVRGLDLAGATAKIRRANCAVGAVERAASRTKRGYVLAQSPAPGAVRYFKSEVRVVVSSGSRRKP
jgi:hypothetical protein